MVQRWVSDKLQSRKRWLLTFTIAFYLVLSTALNLALTSKTHALDILQPVTTILTSLLGPSPRASPPAAMPSPPSSSPPVAAPPAQNPPATGPSASPTAQNTTPSETPSNSGIAPTDTSTGSDFVPISSDLEPVVLGTSSPSIPDPQLLATPPTQLVGSVSHSQNSPSKPEKCARFFGACWYWWVPAATSVSIASYGWYRFFRAATRH